ncbi:hypothetical protein [Chroococcidiopsis sp. SAG 2025]|uniref:hypothetical protein n=1 Tax=Chroococcidiopsis sp. SAG 2025 TaxID=171389 RepID=UPI002936E776|nr:hypothetical protein [Chroococcidiopsis sp. SAG 2025]
MMSIESGAGSRESGAGEQGVGSRGASGATTINRQLSPDLRMRDCKRFKNWYLLSLFSPTILEW